MLPSIDTHERLKVSGNGILVGTSNDTQGAGGLVLDEPSPAGSLNASKGGVGLLLEGLEGAKVLVDGSLHSQLWYASLADYLPRACPRVHHRHPCR